MQTLIDNPVQLRAHFRIYCRHLGCLNIYNLIHKCSFMNTFERQLSGQQLKEYNTERKTVGAMISIQTLDLLGRHIRERPDSTAFFGQPRDLSSARTEFR